MARIATTSAVMILLQVSVLVLTLSPTTNCLSLDERLQLKQLAADYVINSYSVFLNFFLCF